MAKKKDSKVSVASVDRLLKAFNTQTVPVHVEVDGEAIDFEVRRLLDLGAFYNMVHAAVDASFVIDEATGEERYDAVYQQYAAQAAVLIHVANFKPETASDKLYQLMNRPEVMNKIYELWNLRQQDQFIDVVTEQVEFKRQELFASERRKLRQAVDQIDRANDVFMKFTALFEGIDPAQFMDGLQKIASMNETEIARGLVDARDKDFVERRRAELQVLK